MNIICIETGIIHNLRHLNAHCIDFVEDTLGNNNAFGDKGFQVHSNDDGTLSAREETIDWWKTYIKDLESIEADLEALRDRLVQNGLNPELAEEVNQALAVETDLGSHRALATQMIDTILREQIAEG
jgi:hypothetical protein